ncbi:MAG TPA: MarR family transcriptional regulator [Stackebrandtia sp.]|jgi:DNA-binding MarR family transcriptional regulator|uniref:MarR family winged helix-turn-helix transcriptional regulator n=1 Tax=Stackebrandtia sp. TaxID=2023065 RepID=UPI002D61B58C|nr:MarR family transcriptional regulator [Stackebrandtia sp.]HZE40797.1 MarR family transcriptional regulator [Stackebrandtia sp.]
MNLRTDDEVRTAWCETLQIVHTTSCELEQQLQLHHDLGLSEFQVLQSISGQCGNSAEKVLMKDLEATMYLSQSALSRTVTRLEKAGLVVREMCQNDRRSMALRLTDAGRQRWNEAAPTHLAVLRKSMCQEDMAAV